VSIEARHGVTTGISAADRAHTIKVAVADDAKPQDLVVPGHIFPLRAKLGGVLERSGHTEGSVDLARLAGLKSAAVICEIMNDDGSMARMPDLESFSKKHGLPIVSIEDLIKFRLMNDSLVRCVEKGQVQTSAGSFEARVYEVVHDKTVHLAIIKGTDFAEKDVDVRVHRQRPLVDVFSKTNGLVEYGLQMLEKSDAAVLIYLSQQSSGFTDIHEFFEKQDQQTQRHLGQAMDMRLFGIGAQILRDLGVHRMRVHASTQRHWVGIAGFGLEVSDVVVIN
jgi:3,4-dihydroxy 2-butanone 4-phosphate synthase/GTP cyclohydrolase II